VADTTGVDWSADVVEEYNRFGLCDNIVVCDVQRLDNLDCNDSFDVIVVGDIIEHISGPGAMLDGLHRFCGPHTTVIITTPNAFGLPNYMRFALGRFAEGNEHVMAFNRYNLLNLLNRHDYTVDPENTCFEPHARSHGVLFRMGRVVFQKWPKSGGTLLITARSQQASQEPVGLPFD
jgi:predicted TPR repeat methyltransferase